MEAIILAGGKGTRLKSVSGDIPKPMVKIKDTPFLYLLMQQLENNDYKKIILSLGYNSEYIIKSVIRDNPVNCDVEFVVENEPLGTGGAIKKACKYINGDKFLVMNGDTYNDVDLKSLYAESKKYDFLLLGVLVKDTSRYGTLLINDNNEVEKFVEKGVSGKGIINSGVYILSKKIIQSFEKNIFSLETDFLCINKYVLNTVISNNYFIDIGIPEDYFKACKDLG